MAIKQTSSKKKEVFTKTTAIILGATLIGTIGIAGLTKLTRRTNNGLEGGETTTSISQELEVAGLVLTEDFDINSDDAVRKRAQEIYDYSEKEHDVDTIVNIIYYVNGAYDKIIFPASEDKAAYVQKIVLSLSEILDDNLLDDVEAQRNMFYKNENANVTPKEDQEIYAYMFMASTNTNPNAVDVSKQDALRFAQIVNEQLENIKNGTVDKFETTADKYYDFYKRLKNRTGKDEEFEINAGYSAVLYKDVDSKNILVTMFLDDAKNKELDENYANSYLNLILNDIQTKLGINVQSLIDKAIEEGNAGNDLPPAYSEEVDKKDEQDANQRPDYEEHTNEPIVVDKGGDKLPGSSGKEEQVNEPTTSITEEEIVADVPNGGYHEEVIPGGVEISYTDADDTIKRAKK